MTILNLRSYQSAFSLGQDSGKHDHLHGRRLCIQKEEIVIVGSVSGTCFPVFVYTMWFHWWNTISMNAKKERQPHQPIKKEPSNNYDMYDKSQIYILNALWLSHWYCVYRNEDRSLSAALAILSTQPSLSIILDSSTTSD